LWVRPRVNLIPAVVVAAIVSLVVVAAYALGATRSEPQLDIAAAEAKARDFADQVPDIPESAGATGTAVRVAGCQRVDDLTVDCGVEKSADVQGQAFCVRFRVRYVLEHGAVKGPRHMADESCRAS
jgi:hypothetical protein